MKPLAFFLFTIGSFILMGCEETPSTPSTDDNSIIVTNDSTPTHNDLSTSALSLLNNIKGKWILSSYIDSIYTRKAIQPFSHITPLVHKAIFVQIADQVELSGSIYTNSLSPINLSNSDSLLRVEVFKDTFW